MKCMVVSKLRDADGREVSAPNNQATSLRVTKGTRPDVNHSRKFFDNRFVYLVISQRARGLSIGVNMNPDKSCNFNCRYCEVDRTVPGRDSQMNIEVMSTELRNML